MKKENNLYTKKLFSAKEAGQVFGIGRDKMRELVKKDPTIPTIKVGSYTKINAVLFQEWLNEKTIQKEAI